MLRGQTTCTGDAHSVARPSDAEGLGPCGSARLGSIRDSGGSQSFTEAARQIFKWTVQGMPVGRDGPGIPHMFVLGSFGNVCSRPIFCGVARGLSGHPCIWTPDTWSRGCPRVLVRSGMVRKFVPGPITIDPRGRASHVTCGGVRSSLF